MLSALLMLLAAPPVQITGSEGHWQLLRGGGAYVIKGAGGNGSVASLVAAGGNSLRTWGVDQLPAALAKAHESGITIAAGIWLQHKDGMNYVDAGKVAAQAEGVRTTVARYKDDPAVLLWGIGNEMENGNDTPALWLGVEAAVQAAKSADPNHPVMTSVAEVSQEKIDLIRQYAPDVDILGINSYGGLPSLAKRLKQFGWTKPYIVTEFGPLGHWERPKTAWGAPIEQSSTEKAAQYQSGYDASIGSQSGWCLGCYAFFWGSKQEATPTWFGMMLSTGEPLEAADVMEKAWTGFWPKDRAPRIEACVLAGDHDAILPGAQLNAAVKADGAGLTYRWEIRPEVAERRPDGTGEAVPQPLDVGLAPLGAGVTFRAPTTPGNYRLYLYVLSSGGRAATANIPFRVA